MTAKNVQLWMNELGQRTAAAFAASLLTAAVLFVAACGVPNLDPPECSASRTAVHEFYSFHFGNEMGFSQEGLKLRERFLTPEMIASVRTAPEGTDPFTTGDADFPKAFRAGECRVVSNDRTQLNVLLFWKNDTRTEQRKIRVDTLMGDDRWLVDKIER